MAMDGIRDTNSHQRLCKPPQFNRTDRSAERKTQKKEMKLLCVDNGNAHFTFCVSAIELKFQCSSFRSSPSSAAATTSSLSSSSSSHHRRHTHVFWCMPRCVSPSPSRPHHQNAFPLCIAVAMARLWRWQ